MEKRHVITISGKPGSGKSTTADRTAEILSYTRHSSGDLVRKFITENKMTLKEYNKKAMADHSLDQRIDQKLRDLREHDDIVIDSRLGFYWIPESFKVYLDLDMKVASERIYTDAQLNARRRDTGEAVGELADAEDLVKERIEQEQSRFQALYHVDPYKLEHFDLIIDTLGQSPKSVSLLVHDAYKHWLVSETWKQVRVGPMI